MTEIWKDVNGYDGLYKVSNLGRIKSFNGSILKNRTCKSVPYERVVLKGKNLLVHRLVADAFIPNPRGLKEVNHKDENILNNSTDNLEWCDRKYNNAYGSRVSKTHKKVNQFNMKNELVNTWDSIRSVENYGFRASAVCKCCKGEIKSHKNYIWKYVDNKE